MSAQDGDVLVDAPSKEQLAAPGLGKLPPTLLPESNSRPGNDYFDVVDDRSFIIVILSDTNRFRWNSNQDWAVLDVVGDEESRLVDVALGYAIVVIEALLDGVGDLD